ncbi:hypothetical protein BJP47_23340 [Paenibacillus odorifer]|nr:hypothetical protein BJP47_23340 [Paenibacillus odorifer]
MFDSVQDVKVRGMALQVDRQLRQIKFQLEEDYGWIKIGDVIDAITEQTHPTGELNKLTSQLSATLCFSSAI